MRGKKIRAMVNESLTCLDERSLPAFGGAVGDQGLTFQNACASLSARPPRASPTTQTGRNSSGEEGTLIFANKR